tara:strand:+ start:7244 stop:8383 length:1140 start_codon:yes stop_codon:yes gene_type:complete
MINKRLLIKNLLAHNDESSFYDKKLQINISSKEGKAKFLKHICALSNSNPNNNSYIVIGVDDQYNHIIGVDFFDDSKIQNLINAYLSYPPIIQYENIPFPHLNDDKVVGLVTIRPKESQEVTSLSKNIWKYFRGSVFFREGSISMPKVVDIELTDSNSEIVSAIEAHAQNNIEYTLDGVFDFMAQREDYDPKYKVFKEYFVICWSGHKKTIENQTFYSRVDIALINEQVRLFYSTLDAVEISYNKDSFEIIEYVNLGLNGENTYFKLEKTTITFGNNAAYSIDSKLLFSPPQYDKKALHHIFNANNALMERLKQGADLTSAQTKDLKNVPATYLICYFNGIEAALTRLQAAKPLLHKHSDAVYALYKESMRILRKAKYN